MSKLDQWVESDDAVVVDSQSNGFGRGDGYDVATYRSKRTGRYLVCATWVRTGRVSWFVADTLDDARAVGAAGYDPGGAPGAYRYVSRQGSLLELRAQ